MYENPCKPDCPDRSPTCHTECPKYAAYYILNDLLRDQRYKEKQTQADIWNTYQASKKKKRRRPYADNRYGR